MSATTGSEQIPFADRGKTSHAHIRLHGHPLGANAARASVAEALGTFFLVLTITSTVISATLDKPVAGAAFSSLAVPIAGGLMLAAAVAGLGPISGAHLNPAVTIALALNRRFPWRYVPAYAVAQFSGAISAALVAWALYGNKARTVASLGATYPASGVGAWRALGGAVAVLLYEHLLGRGMPPPQSPDTTSTNLQPTTHDRVQSCGLPAVPGRHRLVGTSRVAERLKFSRDRRWTCRPRPQPRRTRHSGVHTRSAS